MSANAITQIVEQLDDGQCLLRGKGVVVDLHPRLEYHFDHGLFDLLSSKLGAAVGGQRVD